jgi:hypothetical protein
MARKYKLDNPVNITGWSKEKCISFMKLYSGMAKEFWKIGFEADERASREAFKETMRQWNDANPGNKITVRVITIKKSYG